MTLPPDKPTPASDLDRLRKMRAMFEGIAVKRDDHPTVWELLRATVPQATSHEIIATALDLAYEIGYADGESSANADWHVDNPYALQRCRELLAEAGEA